jgi:hypothetical protein
MHYEEIVLSDKLGVSTVEKIFFWKKQEYIWLTSTDIITSSNIGYVTYADIGTIFTKPWWKVAVFAS